MKTYIEPHEIELMENSATNLRDRLLIHLLFRLGCRLSEALALTVEDVDLGRNTITIKHLKVQLKLSCPDCGTRLSKANTYCPGCAQKVSKVIKEKFEQSRRRILPIDSKT